ncbi:MAG TPA: hypothetical protein VF541_14130 [Longimicrobium sp.]|jgi:hypothetical protein
MAPRFVRTLALLTAAAFVAVPARAQQQANAQAQAGQARSGPAAPARGVTFAAGAMNFDLSGTGNTPVGSLRADFPFSRYLGVEAAVAVARPQEQSGTSTLVFPEVQLQASAPLGPVAPYAGVGWGSTAWRAASAATRT